MNTPQHRRSAWPRRSWAVALLVASLTAACSDRASQQSGGQKLDAAVEKTGEASVAAARKAAELAEKARDNTRAYFESPEVRQHAADAKATVRNAVDGRRPPASEDASKK